MQDQAINELVELAKQNDLLAKEELCNRTYNPEYFAILKIVQKPEDAQDILHNTYVTLFSRLYQLNEDQNFITWFKTSVFQKTKVFLEKKEMIFFSEIDQDNFDESNHLIDENMAFQPDNRLDLNETQRLMENILDQLPAEQRMCIIMYYLDDFSINEIAEILQISISTVKNTLYAAREQIQNDVLILESKETEFYSTAVIPMFVYFLKRAGNNSVAPQAFIDEMLSDMASIKIEPLPLPEIEENPIVKPKKSRLSVKAAIIIIVLIVIIGGTIWMINSKNSSSQGSPTVYINGELNTAERIANVQAKNKELSQKAEQKNNQTSQTNDQETSSSNVDSINKEKPLAEKSTEEKPKKAQKKEEEEIDIKKAKADTETFIYKFKDFQLVFPKSLEKNLEFKTYSNDGDWLDRLDIHYIPNNNTSDRPLLAQIGHDYADNEKSLMERYDSTFEKFSDSEIALWGVVSKGTTVWDKVGLYPLAFRVGDDGTPHYIEWNAEKFMNSGIVPENSPIYSEFMETKSIVKDVLYNMHTNRNTTNTSTKAKPLTDDNYTETPTKKLSGEFSYEDILGFQIPFPKEWEGLYRFDRSQDGVVTIYAVNLENIWETIPLPNAEYATEEDIRKDTGYVMQFYTSDNVYETAESPLKTKPWLTDNNAFSTLLPGEGPHGQILVTGNKDKLLTVHLPTDSAGITYVLGLKIRPLNELYNLRKYVTGKEFKKMRNDFLVQYDGYNDYISYMKETYGENETADKNKDLYF